MSLEFAMLRLVFVVSFVVVNSGCWHSGGSALMSVPDKRPVFSIQSDTSFAIEFGRGSGWHGLDTISIDEIGMVLIHQITNSGLEKSSFTLKPSEVMDILASLRLHEIMNLDREYHDESIADGTQWVFLVTQGDNTKTIYFNNHFPKEITDFASDLDSILHIDDRKLHWETAGSDEVSERLWDAIKD